MEPIKAFVAHSFTGEDADVVAVILKCLDRIAELHPRFSWEHADHPEPTVVDAKVLSLISDKNLFIGICTRKEYVVSPSLLSQRWIMRSSLTAKETDFHWKTSDWIIQEIGLAIGRNMKIILLVEEDTRSPGALQGNLEYIEFNRNAPERCLEKLLGMIASISPHTTGIAATVEESNPRSSQDSEPKQSIEWTKPKADWKLADYQLALFYFVATKNETEEKRITELFLASDEGGIDGNRKQWSANRESLHIRFGRGDLEKLERFSSDSPKNSEIAADLALGYLYYKEYEKAAKAYLLAADTSNDAQKQIELLGDAALNYLKAENAPLAHKLEIRMRQLSEDTGQGEVKVLGATKNLAEQDKDDETVIGVLERLIEINPGDVETRFSLAYKYSDMNREDMAAFHYSRIPQKERTSLAWNNLGVSLERLGLPIHAVIAYRESEKLGETLSMSNLAIKFLNAGFLLEAKKILDAALKIENHHKNVVSTLVTINDSQDAESKKETSNHEIAKPISEYYRQFGHSLAGVLSINIIGKWKSPNCTLEFAVDGVKVVATGSYEVAGTGLLYALGTSVGNSPAPLRYIEKYSGLIRGLAIVGSVSRIREGEAPPKASTLLMASAATSPTVLMWITGTGDKIHVLERYGKTAPNLYELHKV